MKSHIEEKPDHLRYVREIVWLPSYLGLSIFLMGAFDAGTLVLMASLIGCRLILELAYRLIFAERRHEVQCQGTAFMVQCIIWAAVWWLHA